MFEIPASPQGIPISWKGHYYGRDGESLSPLCLDKIDQIRRQTLGTDWSARVIENATPADLDPAAIGRAREAFALRHADRFSSGEVAKYDQKIVLEAMQNSARLGVGFNRTWNPPAYGQPMGTGELRW